MKFIRKIILIILILSYQLVNAEVYDLNYSTYFGGSGTEAVECITYDNNGNIYIYGYTTSSDFPTTKNSFQEVYAGGSSDLFLVKLNSKFEIIWSTLIGGNSEEYPKNIKFHDNYLWVVSDSRSSNFPITQNAHQKSFKGHYDGIFMKFDLNGKMLYSSYLGSQHYDVIDDVVIDKDDNVWFTGRVYGEDLITTIDAEQKQKKKGVDSFISKFDKNGKILYSSFLGGNSDDFAMDLAYNKKTNIVAVIGYTNSKDFPTMGEEAKTEIGNAFDSFISYFNLEGKMIWSTYLGGNGKDYGEHITSDNDSSFVFRIFTNSEEIMTTKNTFQKVNKGNFSSYIGKFNATGKYEWGTFLGGSNSDAEDNINNKGGDLYITPENEVLVSGFTESDDFPITNDAIYKEKGFFSDCFFSKFDSEGNLVYSSFLGGNRVDEGRAILFDNNKLYVVGWTESLDFPTTNDAISKTKSGIRDGFLSVFAPDIICSNVLDSEFGFNSLNLHSNKFLNNDSRLRLTELSSFDAGYAYNKNKLNLADGFITSFSFIVSNGSRKVIPVPTIEEAAIDTSLPGADGLALVLSGALPEDVGQSGGKIGYGGFRNSLAIEIDLYYNEEYDDPNGNHIAVQIPRDNNKLYPHHNSENTLAMNDNIVIIKSDSSEVYNCEVTYRDNRLSVYLGNTSGIFEKVIEINDFDLNNYLDLEYEANGFIGFTSSTGQGVELHDITRWNVCTYGEVQMASSVEGFDAVTNTYPNPASEYVNVVLKEYYGNKSIVVTDIMGREVIKIDNLRAESEMKVDLSELISGVYFVSIYSEEQLVNTDKIVKN